MSAQPWPERRREYISQVGRIEVARVPLRPPLRKPVVKCESLAHADFIPKPTLQKFNSIEAFWQNRPCWMCGNLGLCGHREYEVALAYVAADPARVGEPGGG